jgi:glycosyltransferase involved in cell wall biosynthesis
MRPTLTIFTIAYNLEKIRYPWRASLASACHFADEVLVAECFSTDGTREALLHLQNSEPKIRRIDHPWGSDCSILKVLAEMLSGQAKSEWVFYLNADEVLHENSHFPLAEMARKGQRYGSAHYTHFLGDFYTTWPFMYERVPRLMHGNIAGWHEDACGITYKENPVDVPVEVQHYGKVSVGREVQCGLKEQEFQQLYLAHGFPDMGLMDVIGRNGRLSYADFMRQRWKDAGLPDESIPFRGTHSCFVKPWIEEMKHRQSANT